MSTEIAEYRGQSNGTALATLPSGAPAVIDAMKQLKAIRTFVVSELHDGIDYGVIPGTNQKKVLLQPGAQKINMFLNVRATYDIQTSELGNGHVEYMIETTLLSRSNGEPLASGIGSATTMETKHRFRNGQRLCPACGKPSLIKTLKGRNPGGYWCVPDKGGCGANFNAGDKAVEGQVTGKVDNDNIYDQRNTVLKMGKKRSLVDASINLACLADEFTQDIEDTIDLAQPEAAQAEPQPEPAKATPPPARSEARAGTKAAPAAKTEPAPAKAPAKSPLTWAQYVDRVMGAWDKITPNESEAELTARKNRYVNRIATDAINDEKLSAGEITKPNKDGKTVRESSKVWFAVQGLYEHEREWLINASKLYLEEKKREADGDPTPIETALQ